MHLEKGNCVPHLISIEIRCCFLKLEHIQEEGNEKKRRNKKNICIWIKSEQQVSVNHNWMEQASEHCHSAVYCLIHFYDLPFCHFSALLLSISIKKIMVLYDSCDKFIVCIYHVHTRPTIDLRSLIICLALNFNIWTH